MLLNALCKINVYIQSSLHLLYKTRFEYEFNDKKQWFIPYKTYHDNS